ERVRMIGESAPLDRHGLETAMRMSREPRHHGAVIHPPTVDPLEVHAEIPPGERRVGAELVVARGIAIVVIRAEQERIDARPRETERPGEKNRIVTHAKSPTLCSLRRGSTAVTRHAPRAAPELTGTRFLDRFAPTISS